MSTQPPDEAMRELLGAYALDAVDAAERDRIDGYLETTLDARAELDELRETAAMLALAEGQSETAPAELWMRIEAALGTPSAAAATVTELDTARRTRRGIPWRLAAPVAAAAAVVIGLLGYQVVDLRGQVDDAQRAGPASVAAAYDRALDEPGAREVTLASGGGGDTDLGRIVVLEDGTGYLVNDGLAPLGSDETYQLWALVGDANRPTAISAGVLGANPRAAAFKVSGPVVGFALTVEDAGGVVSSEHDPVALATF
jgi:anti-sigma-K factor RskA